MWKFKSLKGRDKWLFLLTVGVILCILAFPMESMKPKGQRGDNQADSSQKAAKKEAGTEDNQVLEAAAPVTGAGDAYEAELEKRVREILKTVDGVGKVDVMIVLKSSEEQVVRVDKDNTRSVTDEKDSGGGTRKIENEELSEETVIISGDGKNMPIVEKRIRPELSGIIISAAGGGSPVVRAEISAAMEALFDLPAHKIKVLKRVE